MTNKSGAESAPDRFYFFLEPLEPFDFVAALCARALKSWFFPVRSVLDWIRRAAFGVMGVFLAIALLLCWFNRFKNRCINMLEIRVCMEQVEWTVTGAASKKHAVFTYQLLEPGVLRRASTRCARTKENRDE